MNEEFLLEISESNLIDFVCEYTRRVYVRFHSLKALSVVKTLRNRIQLNRRYGEGN